MQYNISPETLVEPKDYTAEHHAILAQGVSIERMLNQELDLSALVALNQTLTPNGQFFRKDVRGFLPQMMEDMMKDRDKYKSMMIDAEKEKEKTEDKGQVLILNKKIARYNNLQQATKVTLNSCYGALGNEHFRFFDVRQASAITYSGKLSIRWVVKHINIFMNKWLGTENVDYVIASDTDSMYLSLEKVVELHVKETETKEIIAALDEICKKTIQPVIDKTFEDLKVYANAYEQKMIMKREVLCDTAIWTAKKRYILNVWNKEGVTYAKPKIKISGLEAIKSSTPAACRTKIKEGLDIILNKTEGEMIDFIDAFRKTFATLPISDIAFPRGVNGLEKYAGDNNAIFRKKTPIHVRGSLMHNYYLKEKKLEKKYPVIKEGEKIKFIYLKEPNPINSNIISYSQVLPDEFGLAPFIDYNTQYDKSFVEPLKIILDAINWKTERMNTFERAFAGHGKKKQRIPKTQE